MARTAYRIDLGPVEVFFSYDVVVGIAEVPMTESGRVTGPREAWFVQNAWSNTTGRHISAFRQAVGGNPPLPQEEFRAKVKAVMAAYGLRPPKLEYF